VIGWIIYIIGVVVFPYNGIFTILFQFILGALITGIIVLVSWLMGLIIRKYIPKKYLPTYRTHLVIIVICIFFLVFGYSLGLTSIYINSELGTTFQSGNMIVDIGAYLLIIFFIANWPIKQKRVSEPHISV
jgi:hypothetical protein